MKSPKTDLKKTSLPGKLKIIANEAGLPVVYPHDCPTPTSQPNLLTVVYDHGPMKTSPWETFDAIRERVKTQWGKFPPSHDARSKEIKDLMEQTIMAQLAANGIQVD